MYRKIIQTSIKNNAAILTHTPREKFLIEKTFGYNKVYDHPISFLSPQEVKAYQSTISREDFLKKHQLDEKDIVIGIFGFIAPYKGHHTLFNALRFLPDHYKLLVFGSQHPGLIQQNEPVEPYVGQLLEVIENHPDKNLQDRIKFVGSLNDDEFIKSVMSCDINVLPYWETNQSGSGIAALTLETQANAIFSMNYSFIELAKYAPDCFTMFTIGNYLELAQNIKTIKEKPLEALKSYHKKYNIDTNIVLHKKIFEETEADVV
jgi:glycosyltransferase involved in cell wall biosynthesis